MCTWVNAIENARAAALASRYLRTSASAVARSGATPVAKVTRTNAPGARRTRSRSAATGSSTAPVVPDSARPSSASGLAGERPRPRKRARSVSHSTAPPSRPSTPSTWNAQAGVSSALRGRRLNSRPALCASNSVSMNSFPNAGCARSSSGRASTISA